MFSQFWPKSHITHLTKNHAELHRIKPGQIVQFSPFAHAQLYPHTTPSSRTAITSSLPATPPSVGAYSNIAVSTESPLSMAIADYCMKTAANANGVAYELWPMMPLLIIIHFSRYHSLEIA